MTLLYIDSCIWQSVVAKSQGHTGLGCQVPQAGSKRIPVRKPEQARNSREGRPFRLHAYSALSFARFLPDSDPLAAELAERCPCTCSGVEDIMMPLYMQNIGYSGMRRRTERKTYEP